MSYCVNCGVELAESEKCCPLCQVEVSNPKAPWVEPQERPYPRHIDPIMHKVDRRYFASLIALLLIIPCVITMLLDVLANQGISWSAYLIGAVALIYVCVLLPLYFKKYHTIRFLSADCAAMLLYLFFIERMNDGRWFLGYGLPLTVSLSVCILALALLFTKTPASVLVKCGAVLIALGLFVVSVEVITDLADQGVLELNWSIYALIPCVILGVAAFILDHRQSFKERIRRRLFY